MKRGALISIIWCVSSATPSLAQDAEPLGDFADSTTAFQDAEEFEDDGAQALTYDDLVEMAQERFEAQRYEEAVEALDQAYALKPNPNLLYNKARILEAKGDLELALTSYEAFAVAPNVELEYRRETLERIRVIKEVLALKQAPEEATQQGGLEQRSAATSAEVATAPVEVDTGPRPSRRVGAVMLGLGAAALATGGVFGVLALNEHGEWEQAETLEQRRERAEQVEQFSSTADLLYLGGGVVTAVGLALFIAGRGERRVDSAVRVVPAWDASGRAGAAMSFEF